MKMENQSCCFCFNIVSEGSVVDSDTLDLLKFLIVNVDVSALEHSIVCDGCNNTITEVCGYKTRNSAKMLMETNNEIDSVKHMCQKCEKVCEQGNMFLLMNCITEIDWSDFVNYLFVDQDPQSLESLQICDSCRISVSNIQQFLKLVYIYDHGKMKYDIDKGDINATRNENLVEVKVEIKQEFENFVIDDKTEIENVIHGNTTEMLCSDGDYISYADFKCKNEEVELKLENDYQSTDRCKKEVVGEEMTSSFNKEGEPAVKHKHNRDYNCTLCSQRFTEKRHLDNHLLRIHKSKDNVTCKILECDNCGYETTIKNHLLRHKLKHGIKVELEKYKCQYCVYETCHKNSLNRHIKIHNNVQGFKCTFCSKSFTDRRNLDGHLLKVHKSKDSVTSKIHKCDKCSYESTRKDHLLKHKLKHCVKVEGLEKYKCQYCVYDTFNKNDFVKHIKAHNNIRDFNCSLCSKIFTERRHLDNHLLKVHKSKDNVTCKIYECDKCSYETTIKDHLLRHKLKHGVKAEELKKHKCQYCKYETYYKSHLNCHIKTHNTVIYKCTLCSKIFTDRRYLDDHFLTDHKCRDNVISKIHECDKCSYETTIKDNLLKHKLKHALKLE